MNPWKVNPATVQPRQCPWCMKAEHGNFSKVLFKTGAYHVREVCNGCGRPKGFASTHWFHVDILPAGKTKATKLAERNLLNFLSEKINTIENSLSEIRRVVDNLARSCHGPDDQ